MHQNLLFLPLYISHIFIFFLNFSDLLSCPKIIIITYLVVKIAFISRIK